VPEYHAALKASVEKELFRLPDSVVASIFPRIKALATDPRPHGSKKLIGGTNEWRIRMGDYRVVYTVDDQGKKVEVTRIAHRREVYQ
jgi:mRNA interferase RelE/StbE